MNRQEAKLRLKVIHTVEQWGLFDGCRHMLCCLSGGMDSSVLLHVLLSLSKRYRFKLSAVHVNHGIRGSEADRDESFCAEMCRALGVDFVPVRVDVPTYAAEKNISIELAARKLRYDAFESVMSSIGADRAATAHNADDNAETLIFNIIRGTSTSGICSIPYRRGNYIRPLLAVSRQEIAEYSSQYNIGYVTDSTNSDDAYTRNFIRHNIVPLCLKLNPSFLDAVTRLTDSAKRDEALILSSGLDKRREIVAFLEDNGIFGVNNDMIIKLAEAADGGGTRDFVLSCGRKLSVVNGAIMPSPPERAYNYENKELIIGDNSFFDGAVTVNLTFSSENFREIYKTFTTVGFISDIISGSVFIRGRLPGDSVTVCGVHKSVKKELINKKVPKYLRDALPVFCVGDKIAYVPYVGVDDAFAPKGEKSLKISVVFKL